VIYYHINPINIASRDRVKFQECENLKGREDLEGQEALFQDEPGNTTHE
jgi:hypothetical protein